MAHTEKVDTSGEQHSHKIYSKEPLVETYQNI